MPKPRYIKVFLVQPTRSFVITAVLFALPFAVVMIEEQFFGDILPSWSMVFFYGGVMICIFVYPHYFLGRFESVKFTEQGLRCKTITVEWRAVDLFVHDDTTAVFHMNDGTRVELNGLRRGPQKLTDSFKK